MWGNQLGFASKMELRGFGPGLAYDGITVGSGFYEPDYAIFDRLEIVKGPSSVVYGSRVLAGLVNFVTKSATPQTVDLSVGPSWSWNSFRAEGQLCRVALELEKWHVRAIGIVVGAIKVDSFINELNHQTDFAVWRNQRSI